MDNLNLSAILQWMCESVFSSFPGVTQCRSSRLSNSLSGIQSKICVNLRERNFGQNILGLVSGISWQHCFVVNVFQPSSASHETKPCCDQLLDCNLHWSRLWHCSVFVPREERNCVQSREEHHVVGSTAGSVTGMPSVFIHSFTWKKF